MTLPYTMLMPAARVSVAKTIRTRWDSERQRETSVTELFREESRVDASQWVRETDGYSMPVTIAVPVDALPRRDGEASTHWFLEVSLEGSGIGAKHAFDLPVFDTEESAGEVPESRRGSPARGSWSTDS